MNTTPDEKFDPFVCQAYDTGALSQFACEVSEWAEQYIKDYCRSHGLPETFDQVLDAVICLNMAIMEDPKTHLGGGAVGQYYLNLAGQTTEMIQALADLNKLPGQTITDRLPEKE